MKTSNILIQNIFRLSLIFLLLLTIGACSKDDVVNPPPGTGGGGDGGGDTNNVTFSGTVWPIISANCTSCHTGPNANNGILLTDYNTVKAQASIPSGSAGSLLGAITHAAGNTAMPFGRTKLSDSNIDKITTWINAGMPNN